jgi:hypothetical protein
MGDKGDKKDKAKSTKQAKTKKDAKKKKRKRVNHLWKDLRKVTVILKEKYYNGSESVRTFKCETGSGCTTDSIGNEIFGTFADGEKGRIESYEIEKTKE